VPSRRATLAAFLAAAGPAGCLSGGATGDGSDSGTPAATPTDRRTPTPTPTPEVTEVPALYGPQSLAPPTLGDPDAEVTVAVYEDFRCPHCHDYHAETFDRLREEYIDEGTVRYEHHDFPVINENSFQIAVAGDAVGYDAGDDAFWEFAAAVFGRATGRTGAGGPARRRGGRRRGPVVRSRRARPRGAVLRAVARRETAAQGRGYRPTPTVRVNGTETNWGYRSVSTAIDAELS
jgi:protein-disulfide isomerase